MTASSLPISPTRLALLAWHKSIGFLILGVIILRLGWRLYSPPPPLPATVPVLQQYAARVSHGLMYVILLAMPLVGWASSSAANLTVSVFGWFVLPNLTAPDKELAQWLISTHVVMAWLLLSIIVLHVTAALWHHFVIRDDVLKRMLPLFTRTHEDSSP
jgi:cytochrome b561